MDDIILLKPIATVRSPRAEVRDDHWGAVVAEIVLEDWLPAEALDGIEDFSHVEVLFHFDRVAERAIVAGARHPRNNPAWPRVGIFAQLTLNLQSHNLWSTCEIGD